MRFSNMKKHGADPKVKKTLVRNCEQNIRDSNRAEVVFETHTKIPRWINASNRSSCKENELGQPSLCSSESIANYLSCVKNAKSAQSHPVESDNNLDKRQLCSKMTRKLNFHINDTIYKNLVELNASIDDHKTTKKEKRLITVATKKDLEPNIEDFFQDEKEIDVPPTIQLPKPKVKVLRKVENCKLHKLVAAYDDL